MHNYLKVYSQTFFEKTQIALFLDISPLCDDSYLYLGSWLCEDNFSVGWRFAGFKEISLFSNRFPVDRDMLALVVLQRSKPLASTADNCSKLRRSHCVLGFSAAKNRNSICDFGYSIWHTWHSQWLVVKKSDYRYYDELILVCTLKPIFSVIIPLVPSNIGWEMDCCKWQKCAPSVNWAASAAEH